MSGKKEARKRRKSTTPDTASKQKQQKLSSFFGGLDKALNKASMENTTRTTVDGLRPAPTKCLIDLTNERETKKPVAKSSSAPQTQSTTHVSNSFVPSLNQPQQSVSHVSDSYIARSAQASGCQQSHNAPAALNDDVSSPSLCEEQEKVVQLVREGKNVFFTGNAGTGKTFVLNRIIDELKAKYGRSFSDKVALAAPTGIAATHIQGTTLNSALGVGVLNFYKDFGTMHKKEVRDRIRLWEVLLVDEVSMLSAEFFQMLEAKLRELRGVGKPAGGLQLIMCGDFFQLPPVTKRWIPGTPKDAFLNWGYAFQAPVWKSSNIEHILLTKVFRQSDNEFITILDDIRYGRNVQRALLRLKELCMRPLPATNGIKPTTLYSRNKQVDEMNETELMKLKDNILSFGAADEVQVNPGFGSGEPSNVGMQMDARTRLERNEFFRDCLAPKDLKLKIGAQVMLLKNLDLQGGPNNSRQLVNGSRGVVVRTMPKHEAVQKLEKEFKEVGGGDIRKLATLDSKTSQKITQLQRQIDMLKRWGGQEVPVVRFRNQAEMEILPALFSTTVNNVGECKRVQIPLKLAWALTIHKCQGLSLDLVQVSLVDCFAVGQAYVALSRARSLEGLQLLDWSMTCVKTDPAVSAFYAALKGGNIESLQDDAWTRWEAMRNGSSQPEGNQIKQGGSQGQGSRSLPNSMGSQSQQWQSSQQLTGGKNQTGDKCFHCGQSGHWASKCPNKQQRR